MKKLILVALGLMLCMPTVAMANGYGPAYYGAGDCYAPVVSPVVIAGACEYTPVVSPVGYVEPCAYKPVVSPVVVTEACEYKPVVTPVRLADACEYKPVVTPVRVTDPVAYKPVVSQVVFADCSRYYVNSNVNIRECPYTSSSIVGTLSSGSYCYGAPYNGTNWYSIFDDGGAFRGYCYGSYLK